MGERPPRMSYWLLPEESSARQIQNYIASIAEQFEGPHFIGHLTGYFGIYGPTENAPDLVATTAAELGPFELSTEGLHFSDSFTKSCYIRFHSSAHFDRIFQFLKGKVECPEDYLAIPHLSLFYGHLGTEAQMIITKQVKLMESVVFDTVVAVANPHRVTSRADVECWREIARAKLTGSRI